MSRWGRLAVAALLLAGAGSAWCAAPQVVAVRYQVAEQSTERVEASVTNPIELALVGLPRASDMYSTTTHGRVEFEIHFEGGATERDAHAVRERLAQVVLATEVKSRTVQLAAPRQQP